MSISGTLVGSATTSPSSKPSCPRCGQERPKNAELCDDCAFIEAELHPDVRAVMVAYEENLSDSQISAKVERSVSFVRRTRARYGLLSARARSENPDGMAIDYRDPNTGTDRFGWIPEYGRGWYYRFTFLGQVRGNTAAVRTAMEKALAADLDSVTIRDERGYENPARPAFVIHTSAAHSLLERARREAATEICDDVERCIQTSDILYVLLGGESDQEISRAILTSIRKLRDLRIVVIKDNKVVEPKECLEVLRAAAA